MCILCYLHIRYRPINYGVTVRLHTSIKLLREIDREARVRRVELLLGKLQSRVSNVSPALGLR